MKPARAAATLFAASVLAWSAVDAQTPADTGAAPGAADAIIVELALGRALSRTVPAYRAGEEAFLPLGQFTELAEIAARPLPGGAFELMLQPGAHRVTIDPASSVIRGGGTPVAFAPADRISQAGDLYVSTRVLADLLRIRFAVSWSDLTVAVLDPDSLPVGRRLARERARAAYRAGVDARTPDLALGTDRTRWDGMVLDYSLLAPSQDLLGGAYFAGLGLNLMGGSLEANIASEGPPRTGEVRVDGSWTGVWRTNPWVSQLRVGDGLSSGPRPRSARGFAISNVPFLRPALFGDIPFQGDLGPGWQIEAYRGGRLLAIDSANALGRFGLDVPVEYGENPVDFIAYGPFGEVRQFNQTYRVGTEAIPARRVEYGVSFGACRSASCRANGNLDLRYGLSRRWTVRGGMDQFWRDTLPALSHPYVGVTGSIGNAWAVELEGVAAAVVRGVARYEPTEYLRLSTEFDHFATGVVQPILTPDGRRHQWTTNASLRPFRQRDNFYLDATPRSRRRDHRRQHQRPAGRLAVRRAGPPGAGLPIHALQQSGRRRHQRVVRVAQRRLAAGPGARARVRAGVRTRDVGGRYPRRHDHGVRVSLPGARPVRQPGGGRGLDPRRRHHAVALSLDPAALAPGHDQRQRAAARAGRREPVRAGLPAVRPREPPHGLHQRAVDRAGRGERPGVPGREQRRAVAAR